CTMKYNPKINEVAARLEGLADLHPLAPVSWLQGALALYHDLERYLAEITGLSDVTLQPAAGAHGEYTGMAVIRAHLIARDGRPRTKVLIPDTAHGTNPATCAMLGYQAVPLQSSERGILLADDVAAAMSEDVAGIMVTNPNTLGLFEENIRACAEIVHAKGGLVYCDGANMNALLGRARPGDMGVDAMHLNLHKTVSTPHGGGGPGSGPVCVQPELAPYLPIPRVVRGPDGYTLTSDRPLSIGRVKAYLGNFGMHVRAYTYIGIHGDSGIKDITRHAVLNANYIRVKLRDTYKVPYDRICAHEFVLEGHFEGVENVHALDISKRLMDYGIHPPTNYFPLIVPEALLIEPTETEDKATLDNFVEVMKTIAQEAKDDPELLRSAPHTTPVKRVDEVRAAKQLMVCCRPIPDYDQQRTPSGD
ncbi:MAG: aminomethyl-transferring glycine dehydrogenase subunit GcvPB, partial [Anaerolineae bacterium]|nr:aminomethyl-transferring glycine dehydrogenase subunit GcvPB [Anaerolineae bacterium]